MKARAGSSSEIVTIPYSAAYEEGFEDMLRRVPDIHKVRETIGWQPRKDLNQTLDEVIAYFRERG